MIRAEKGQAIIEVALMVPFLLILVLGVIELSNAIDTYMVLSELTREGASMTSRGTPADVAGPDNDALDVIMASASPVIDTGTPADYKIIYSRIGPSTDPNNPNSCADVGDTYIVLERVERGSHSGTSQVGSLCGTAVLPDIDSVATGQDLFVLEVFHRYNPITGLDNYGIDVDAFPFYERSVF